MLLETVLGKLQKLDTFEDSDMTRKIMSEVFYFILDDSSDEQEIYCQKTLQKIWDIMYETERCLEKKL